MMLVTILAQNVKHLQTIVLNVLMLIESMTLNVYAKILSTMMELLYALPVLSLV